MLFHLVNRDSSAHNNGHSPLKVDSLFPGLVYLDLQIAVGTLKGLQKPPIQTVLVEDMLTCWDDLHFVALLELN